MSTSKFTYITFTIDGYTRYTYNLTDEKLIKKFNKYATHDQTYI